MSLQETIAIQVLTNSDEPVRFEECSGCQHIHQLVRRGKLWVQPSHSCVAELELNRVNLAGINAAFAEEKVA